MSVLTGSEKYMVGPIGKDWLFPYLLQMDTNGHPFLFQGWVEGVNGTSGVVVGVSHHINPFEQASMCMLSIHPHKNTS